MGGDLALIENPARRFVWHNSACLLLSDLLGMDAGRRRASVRPCLSARGLARTVQLKVVAAAGQVALGRKVGGIGGADYALALGMVGDCRSGRHGTHALVVHACVEEHLGIPGEVAQSSHEVVVVGEKGVGRVMLVPLVVVFAPS